MSFLVRCALGCPQPYPPSFLLPAFVPLQFLRNASHSTERTAKQGSNTAGKRLGAKRAATEHVVPGNIIFKQRGTHWFPGENCGMGRDHTIFAKEKGYVVYYREKWRNRLGERKFIGVVFERGQTLPRPPDAKRIRRLGMYGRERDMGKTLEGVVEESKPAAAVQKASDESWFGVPESTIPNRSRKARRRTPDSQLTLKRDYSYRESNTSIGRVADRMGVKPLPFDKRNRVLAWKRKIAARAKLRETRAFSSKKNKGMKDAKGKNAKAPKGKGKK